MNILTLSIKQKYFDEILAGKKTHEYREIRPTNAKKYITYLCGGKEYPADAELPEEGEIELKPIKYDAIKLLTGAYSPFVDGLMAWTLSRTMNPVHAGFTARTVIIRSALPNGWMNAAANHSKLAKAEKLRGRGSRIPNGCYGIKP